MLSHGEYVVRSDGGNLGDAIAHFAKGFASGGAYSSPCRWWPDRRIPRRQRRHLLDQSDFRQPLGRGFPGDAIERQSRRRRTAALGRAMGIAGACLRLVAEAAVAGSEPSAAGPHARHRWRAGWSGATRDIQSRDRRPNVWASVGSARRGLGHDARRLRSRGHRRPSAARRAR